MHRGRKRCSKCGSDLPRACFSINRSKRDGLSSWCKRCNASYERARGRARKKPKDVEPPVFDRRVRPVVMPREDAPLREMVLARFDRPRVWQLRQLSNQIERPAVAVLEVLKELQAEGRVERTEEGWRHAKEA